MKLRYLLITLLAAVSCGKWVEPKALDFNNDLPERSAEYVQNLLAYKAKKTHKVALAMVEGCGTEPVRRNQHLNVYPDSLDYIAITGTEALHSSLLPEVASMRERGVKFLRTVDYSLAYSAWFEENLEMGEGFLEVLRSYTEKQLSALNGGDYDGILISYLGKTTTTVEDNAQTYFMGEVTNWVQSHSGKKVIFRGYTSNLKDVNILKKCDYIIFNPGNKDTVGEINLAVLAQLSPGVPTSNAIIEVSIPAAIDGEWIGPNAASAVAWIKDYSDRVSKKGIAFSNAQDDYYHPDRSFTEIRGGIKLLD